jgi:serine/threonine protein phosphatase PrpC
MLAGFVAAGSSWQGMDRDNNEDSFLVSPVAVAVADGVGGQVGGEIASSTVIRCLASAIQELDGRALDEAAVLEMMSAAAVAVAERIRQNPSLEGMATTLTALFRCVDGLILAHIGDSRAYLCRDSGVRQVSRDDSLVQKLVESQQITPEESARHPLRSVVMKTITGNSDLPESHVDLSLHEARMGDRWLIASDGLSDYVPQGLIERELPSVRDPQGCAESLIVLAKRYCSKDNTTVVVCDIGSEHTVGQVRTGGAAADASEPQDCPPKLSVTRDARVQYRI